MPTRPGYIWSGTEWVSIGQEAVVAPVSYQTSAPSTPSTGDIWIDSNDDVPGIDTSQFLRWRKTAVGGETSVSGTDDNGLTLQYTPNYEQVYLNGVLLVRGQDYTATDGTSITGLTALAANDVVEVFGVVARVVGDVYTQAQTNSLLDAKSNVSSTGLVLITSATIGSSVASITVSNCFSSTYDNYRILISGGSATNDTNLFLALGASASDYYEFKVYGSYNSNTVSGEAGQNLTRYACGRTSANGHFSAVDVFSPNLANRTFFGNIAVGGATAGLSFFNGGFLNNSTQYTAFTITTGTGTLTGGTIKVYGYK